MKFWYDPLESVYGFKNWHVCRTPIEKLAEWKLRVPWTNEKNLTKIWTRSLGGAGTLSIGNVAQWRTLWSTIHDILCQLLRVITCGQEKSHARYLGHFQWRFRGTEASFSLFISNIFRSVKGKNIAFWMFFVKFYHNSSWVILTQQ